MEFHNPMRNNEWRTINNKILYKLLYHLYRISCQTKKIQVVDITPPEDNGNDITNVAEASPETTESPPEVIEKVIEVTTLEPIIEEDTVIEK